MNKFYSLLCHLVSFFLGIILVDMGGDIMNDSIAMLFCAASRILQNNL